MSDDERALLMNISNDWHAELPRLVYADWLDEQGRPKEAEQIRVEIEMAQVKKQLDRLPREWEGNPPEHVTKLRKDLRRLKFRQKKCELINPNFRMVNVNSHREFVLGEALNVNSDQVPIPPLEVQARWQVLVMSDISMTRRKFLLENMVWLNLTVDAFNDDPERWYGATWYRIRRGEPSRPTEPKTVSSIEREKFFNVGLKRLQDLQIHAYIESMISINSLLFNLNAPCLAKLSLKLPVHVGQLDWPQMPFAATLERLELDCMGLTGASLATLTPERYPCLENLFIRKTACTNEDREAIRQRWPTLRVDGRSAER
jgi:uncharacterized protein (TIGR02996 family)